MDRLLALMLVFFGGGAGCLIRYLTSPDPGFPFMPANVAACLIIGSLYALTRYKVFTNPYVQSFVTVGFLGGLSTFTPLATYAIVQSEPTFIKSFLWFIVYMAAFFVIAVIAYAPTAMYCRKVLKLQPVPSIAAVVRQHQKNQISKEEQRKMQEAAALQYTSMLKELLVAKDMLAKLKEQTATLGRLALVNPQAAKEYVAAKAKLDALQATLQQQQELLSKLDPMQGLAPKDLEPAPGYKEPNTALDAATAKPQAASAQTTPDSAQTKTAGVDVNAAQPGPADAHADVDADADADTKAESKADTDTKAATNANEAATSKSTSTNTATNDAKKPAASSKSKPKRKKSKR